MQQIKALLVFAATGTTDSETIQENGLINTIVLKTPNFTNNSTTTLTILDDDGDTIWTDPSAPRAENSTYLITGLAIPVSYNYSVKATISGDAGAGGGTVTAKLFVESRK